MINTDEKSFIMKVSVNDNDFNNAGYIDVSDLYLNWKSEDYWNFVYNTQMNKYNDTMFIRSTINFQNFPQPLSLLKYNMSLLGILPDIHPSNPEPSPTSTPFVELFKYEIKNKRLLICDTDFMFNSKSECKQHAEQYLDNNEPEGKYTITIISYFLGEEEIYEYEVSKIITFNKHNQILCYLTLNSLPIGRYRLSFSRLSGFVCNNVDKLNDKQYCFFNFYRTNDDLTPENYLSKNIDDAKVINTNTNHNTLYNVSTIVYLSENDKLLYTRYYANVDSEESVFCFNKKFTNNYTTSIDFTSRGMTDKFILMFYVNKESISEYSSQYNTYKINISNFKLEYNIKSDT